MKKWIAMILTMALLCGAAFAETPAAGSIEAALYGAIELLLSDDTAGCLARMTPDMKGGAVELFTQIRALGDVDSITLNDMAEQGGNFAGEFSVVHEGVAYIYALVLNTDGKIGAVTIDPAGLTVEPSDVDENIDFTARVNEVMGMLLRGEYDAVAAQLNTGIASGIVADDIAQIMADCGEVEYFALIYMMQTQGYHQAVIEIKGAEGVMQCQMALDGSGLIAGLYMADKVSAREEMSEKDAQAMQDIASDMLMQLLGGDYEAFNAHMMADMQKQLTPDVLQAAFVGMGAYENIVLHDMWRTNGVTGVDMIVDHAAQEMLYSLILDGENTLVGFGYYPVVRPEK